MPDYPNFAGKALFKDVSEPASPDAGNLAVYSESGVLKTKTSGGTVTTLGVAVADGLLLNVARARSGRVGFSGNYTRSSGTSPVAAGSFSGGSFTINLNAGTSSAGHGKIGWYDPVGTTLSAGSSTIDYSKRIRFALSGMMFMKSTNSKIRIVFGGTGNATDAPWADQNGLTVKGFGAEFALQSGVIQARLIGFNSAYLTPTSYTTLTNGFGNSTNDNTFFAVMIESDGAGNIYLYGGEAQTNQTMIIGSSPLLTLTGGPTTSTSSNRFGPEIQCVNDSANAPSSTPSAQLQSQGNWILDVS